MRSLVLALALMAGPVAAEGLRIQVAGVANGTITIDLFEDVAPRHVAQITTLANSGYYDNIYFHRVIKGFMAQTGDGTFGKVETYRPRYAGSGGSDLPDIPAEFSDIPFQRGVVGMARAQSPDSANSQFFIMFDRNEGLDGNYTVVGQVTAGMEIVDTIKKGNRQANGAILNGVPDRMVKVTVTE